MAIDQRLLGKAIRQIRKVRGMTQAELAEGAHLASGGNSVALIERGKRGVSIESLNALAGALHVPAACLTILATPSPTNDASLKRLIGNMQQLVTKVVELHAALSKEGVGKKLERTKKKRIAADSPAHSSRKRTSAA